MNNNSSKIDKLIKVFKKLYPDISPDLNFTNNLELLFATILSAQCTDTRVNIVTKELFSRYLNVYDYAEADLSELEQIIRSTGFYKNKAKNIIASAKIIIAQFNGKIPANMDALLKLKGVARKTANIVLHHGFGIDAGIAVDTHVKRLSLRLGLTNSSNPIIIERDLMALFKHKDWGKINGWLINHGRKVCKSQRPMCSKCKIINYCEMR